MEKYKIEVLNTSLTSNETSSEFLDSLKKDNGKSITEKICIQPEKSVYYVYLGEVLEDTKIGMVRVVYDENGNKYNSAIVIDDLLKRGYKTKIIGLNPQVPDQRGFFLEISEDIVEGEEDNHYSIKEESERIIKEGINTKEELKEKINVMKKNRVHEIIIANVLAGYKKYPKEVRRPKTIYVDPEPNSKNESIMELALINALIGSPTIFEGIQSTGKNVCAETIAWLLNKPYFLIPISVRSDNEQIFGAKKTVVPEINNYSEDELLEMAACEIMKENGQVLNDEQLQKAAKYNVLKSKAASVGIVTESTEFTEWLKCGGVLMINEMNMAEANFFQSFVNPIGDNTGFINTGDGRLEVNPDCWLLGSQNDGFVGALEQNAATNSRFGCIKFPANTSIKAQLMAEVGGGLDEKYFKACEDLYRLFVQATFREAVSSACLNVRGFARALKACKKFRNITTLKQQIIIHVVNTCPSDEIDQLKNQVYDLINF